MQLLSPQLQIGKSPPFKTAKGGEKRLLLCRPDGSFPQPMAAVPEGPKATPATGSFGEFQTAVQKHQPERPAAKSPGAEHNIQELWFL